MKPAGPRLVEVRKLPEKETKPHFNEVLTDVNSVLRAVPTPFTATIIATAIPAAIKPYSIAVAPDWSFRNFKMRRRKRASCVGIQKLHRYTNTARSSKVA
jgi:hypothetical protein